MPTHGYLGLIRAIGIAKPHLPTAFYKEAHGLEQLDGVRVCFGDDYLHPPDIVMKVTDFFEEDGEQCTTYLFLLVVRMYSQCYAREDMLAR